MKALVILSIFFPPVFKLGFFGMSELCIISEVYSAFWLVCVYWAGIHSSHIFLSSDFVVSREAFYYVV